VNAGAVARLAVVALGAALLLSGCSDDTVQVDAPAPAEDDRAACRTLLDALPDLVADQERRSVEPDDAWGAAWGDPAIVLTCGGTEPAGFKRISTCTTVNGVDWFTPEEQLESAEPVELTMTTVNREQYVEVRMPAEYWPPATTLADLSDVVSRNIEATGSCV
jgi:hypothetical protein